MANRLKRSLETTRGLDVDTRSDSTRKGYHEGYASSAQSYRYHPFIDMANAIDRQTNKTRPDSPIYKPGLITGDVPGAQGIKKATNTLEALKMVQAMKAAKAAKAAKTTSLVRKPRVLSDEHKAKLIAGARAKRASMTPEEIAAQTATRVEKIKATWAEKHSNNFTHINRNSQYTRQELKDIGLDDIQLSKRITTGRGGKTWVSDK